MNKQLWNIYKESERGKKCIELFNPEIENTYTGITTILIFLEKWEENSPVDKWLDFHFLCKFTYKQPTPWRRRMDTRKIQQPDRKLSINWCVWEWKWRNRILYRHKIHNFTKKQIPSESHVNPSYVIFPVLFLHLFQTTFITNSFWYNPEQLLRIRNWTTTYTKKQWL